MTIERLVKTIHQDPTLKEGLAHYQVLSGKTAEWIDFPAGVSDSLKAGLKKSGIHQLYSHQAEAFELANQGKDIIVVTPTASGKTLCYNLPILNQMLEKQAQNALYVFPIKALEQDQKNTLENLVFASGLSNFIRAEIYDGDTPQTKRSKILANPPEIIITNPDMVHRSILSYHPRWEKFLKGLKFLVLDELHTYRGVFGSHIVQVLRRLFRICEHYGTKLQIIGSSATIANPGELASLLSGRNFHLVQKSGAPSAARHFIFISPNELSNYTVSAILFRKAVQMGLKTIAFTKARKITELIYTWVAGSSPELSHKISAYRAGYLPEERREIEKKLFEGELFGVISTSALEMGIDIGELDVCILVGYPGTITATWQRGGRVGRKERDSLIILVAQQNPLDQFFMKHPEAFFNSDYESAVVDPENKPIVKAHIECAGSELAIPIDDPYFPINKFKAIFEELKNQGKLVQSVKDRSYRTRKKRPQLEVDIRSIGEAWSIFLSPEHTQTRKRAVVGSIDGHRVFSECHPGAIYLHRARQFEVLKLDLEKKDAYVEPVEVNYYTQALSEKETEILKTIASKPIKNFIARKGELRVHEQVIGYEKKHIHSQQRLSVHRLDLPEQVFETVGLWIEIEDFIQRAILSQGLNFMGGIHALEHSAIALFPIFAFCDRDDVGGISAPLHPQVAKSAVFIYDGYPGGVGLSERCYSVLEELLERTLEMLLTCDCELGCPACIQSPKCGSGNVPLDKQSAILILKMLLDKPEVKHFIQTGAILTEPKIHPEKMMIHPKEKPEPRILVFDLETKRSAEEVGGWANSHLMGVALAVVWDNIEQKFFTFQEEEVDALIEKLKTADLVVGFNLINFDYLVLSAYTQLDFSKLPTFDLLLDLYQRAGTRFSLKHLVEVNLSQTKLGNGLDSIAWVKKGRFDLVEKYCQKDVELTRDLFYLGLKNHSICFKDNQGEIMELTVDWDLEKIIERAKAKLKSRAPQS